MAPFVPAPISRFPIPALSDMPVDIRERLLAVQEKAGFIPNVFLVLAHRPDEFRAFFAYHDALMDKPGNLTKAEREMIVVVRKFIMRWVRSAANNEKAPLRRGFRLFLNSG